MPRRLPSSEAAQLTVLQMQRAQEIMFESLAKNGKRLCISELDLHFEGMLALHLNLENILVFSHLFPLFSHTVYIHLQLLTFKATAREYASNGVMCSVLEFTLQ